MHSPATRPVYLLCLAWLDAEQEDQINLCDFGFIDEDGDEIYGMDTDLKTEFAKRGLDTTYPFNLNGAELADEAELRLYYKNQDRIDFVNDVIICYEAAYGKG